MQLLPNAKQQFIDQNGLPLASGSVGFYFPGTLNPKPTFQDPAGSIANTNPVNLDSRGQALIWGSGVYRQIVQDASGVTIWDQITEDANAGLTGNITDAKFVAGTDFTPGTTTVLTLPTSPGSIANMWVFFDASFQADDTILSLNGATLTFNSPIPVGVQEVNIKIGTTVAIGTPGNGTVGDSQLNWLGILARTVDSIAALRLIDKTRYDRAAVTGYYAVGDGGGGLYVRDPTDSTSTDNGGTIIVAADGGRWKLSQTQPVTILQFGAKNDGVTDNTAALNAALAAVTQYVGREIIHFPPGKYVFNSTVAYTFPNAGATIVITGAGPDTTELCWPSASIGMQFNYLGAFNGVHIRDLSFTCGTTNIATAIFLNQTATSIPNPAVSNLNEFTNLNFRGSDGYVVNFVWGRAIDVFAVSMVNYTNCAVFGNTTSTQGVGVILRGLNSGCQGVVSNFVDCVFTNMGIGIVYGDWYQGVAVSQCNFGGQIGIQCPIGAGGQDQLTVSNCQINCATAGMQLNQPIPGLIVSNNLIILQQNSTRGITADNYCNFQIVGNQFGGPSLGLNNLGIYLKNSIGGAISGGVITGNIFVSLTNAITLDTTSSRINVQSNAYLNCSVGVTNAGTGNIIGGGSQ